MNILFLSRWYPYPANNGSKIRVYNLLRGLAQWHDVTLLSFTDRDEVDQDAAEIRSLCKAIHMLPWKDFAPDSWSARLGLLNPKPRSVVDCYSSTMVEHIEALLAANHYDIVIASQIGLAGYGHIFRELPALFEEVELATLYEQYARQSALWPRFRYGLTWRKHKRYLGSILRHFNACTVVSEQERQLLAKGVPEYQTVEIIPNCVNLADYENVVAESRPNRLIFTGSFTYSVNYEAMVWFLREVNPYIQIQIPDAHLLITGDHANKSLPMAANVTLTGFVDDIRSLIASSWISMAPILTGGGTRLKILEAMALHVPVVATSKGAEGLDVQHMKHLLIADTPKDFAEAVVRLLREPELHQALADNAYQLVREKYNWPAIMPRFLDLVTRVASSRGSRVQR